ncbi:MAG: lysophospholipid acyltransferase family protein [Thermodesulfobacteriota bacterium]
MEVILAYLIRAFLFLWFSTCRLKRRGYEHFRRLAESGEPFIVSFWHYGVIYIVHSAKSLPYTAMVSSSKDGNILAKLLKSKGFATVRGSRNKGGVSAVKGLLRQVRKGRVAVMVADGSQGPARQAQPGAVLLASITGKPIIPIGWSASRYKYFRSWDRTALPLPFSTITMRYDEPFYIPAKLDSDGVEYYRLELEKRLNELYEKNWQEYGRKEH